MKRTVLIYGTIAGVVVSLFMATTMLITSSGEAVHTGASSMVIGYLGMLIAFTFIFVAIKSYRDKENGGMISFGKAFGIGLLIALKASTLYVATWALVYHNFLPDFMDKYTAVAIEEAKATLSGTALQAKIDEVNNAKAFYATPLGFVLFTYAEILPVGILVSLIAALVLKRKAPKVAVA
jgi:small-conductance mechanosensitive channel